MAFHWKRKSLSKGYASVTFASSSDHHQTGLRQLRRKKCDEVSLLLPITSSMHEGKYLQCYSNTSLLPELTTETNDESQHQLSSSNCRRHLPSTPIPTRKKNIKIHRHHPQHHQQQIRKKSLELYPLPLISEDEEELEEEDEVSAISSTTSSSVSPPSSSACSAAPTSCTTSDSISNYEDSPAAAAASGATAKFTAIHLGTRNAPGIWGVQNIRQPVDDMLMATNSSSTLENPTSAGTSINKNRSHPFKRRGAKQWNKRPVCIEVTSFGLRLSDEKRVIDGLICLSDGGDDADASIADDDNNGDFRNGSSRFYTIKDISYGVQDPRHPSVFAFITVVDEGDLRVVQHPFRCHALLCESPDHARRLTLALAAAFDEHGGRMRNSNAVDDEGAGGGKRLGDLFLVRRLANELKLAIDLRSPDEILAELLTGLKVTEESEA